MAAIVKGDVEKINSYCEEDPGIVGVANYNSPVQVVISGEKDAVERVSKRLAEEKTRVIPLKVSVRPLSTDGKCGDQVQA